MHKKVIFVYQILYLRLSPFFLMPYVYVKFFFRKKYFDSSSDIVVSMTSHSTRIKYIGWTIKSIMLGDVLPNKIILYLDEDDKETAAHTVSFLKKLGVSVRYNSKIGPHSKYFYALDLCIRDGFRLVTADDDIIYPKSWLRELSQKSIDDKNIYCHRAHKVIVKNGKIEPYLTWGRVADTHSSVLNFATGVSGVIYPLSFLKILRGYGLFFLKVSPYADDVWLHYVAIKNGYKISQVSNRPKHFPIVPFTQSIGLRHDNVSQNKNDTQIANTYDGEVISLLAREEIDLL